jgi:beta-lactamase superfamily II metal-dependent hydrolase
VYLKFFDVEHGACALITTSGYRHILVDCGTNNSTGWKPATELLWRGITEIERLIVTNYDEDHASGYRDLIQRHQRARTSAKRLRHRLPHRIPKV